jgi:hypothetical protein
MASAQFQAFRQSTCAANLRHQALPNLLKANAFGGL